MTHGKDPATDPHFGDLPAAVRGLLTRLRLPAAESQFGQRTVLGLYVLINSGICLTVLGALAWVTQQPFVFPSLGPTAFLVFFAGMSVQAAPRNVFFGHLIGVLAGAFALVIFGLYSVPADLESLTPARVGACVLCLSLTLSLMTWLGVPHAPAGATTLIVGLGLLRTPSQLIALMAAVVLLTVMAIGINRLAGLPYPFWAYRAKAQEGPDQPQNVLPPNR